MLFAISTFLAPIVEECFRTLERRSPAVWRPVDTPLFPHLPAVQGRGPLLETGQSGVGAFARLLHHTPDRAGAARCSAVRPGSAAGRVHGAATAFDPAFHVAPPRCAALHSAPANPRRLTSRRSLFRNATLSIVQQRGLESAWRALHRGDVGRPLPPFVSGRPLPTGGQPPGQEVCMGWRGLLIGCCSCSPSPRPVPGRASAWRYLCLLCRPPRRQFLFIGSVSAMFVFSTARWLTLRPAAIALSRPSARLPTACLSVRLACPIRHRKEAAGEGGKRWAGVAFGP